jgi:hypothetical protein
MTYIQLKFRAVSVRVSQPQPAPMDYPTSNTSLTEGMLQSIYRDTTLTAAWLCSK